MEFVFGLKNIIYIVVFIAAIAFLTKNMMKIMGWLKAAQPENRFDNVGQRLARTIGIAFFQKKIIRSLLVFD